MNDRVLIVNNERRALNVFSFQPDIRQNKLNSVLFFQYVFGANARIIYCDFPLRVGLLAFCLFCICDRDDFFFEPFFAKLFLIGFNRHFLRVDQSIDFADQFLK